MPDYETFPTIEAPTRIRITDTWPSVKTDYEGGYEETRAQHTRKLKTFEVEWRNNLATEDLLDFLEFWREHGSVYAFYWQFPLEMYGYGGFGGAAADEDDWIEGFGGVDDGFGGAGMGEGPILFVRFAEDTFQHEYNQEWERWNVRVRMKEV